MLFNYTTELRTFFENLPVNADQTLSHAKVIENGRSTLFDFDYPIFDDAYKKVFETHFIRRFYMRQIGFETIGLFKFQLETWLLINMIYWNKMFESELLQYDPLTNAKMEVTHTKKNDKTQNDIRDITNASTVEGNTETTTDRTTNSEVVETSNTSGNSTAIVDHESDATNTSSKSENITETDDNFDRHLESNNPDSRLSLTANDGEGVIEYASSIKENTENNSRTRGNESQGESAANVIENSTNTQTSEANSSGNSNIETLDNVSDSSSSSVTGNETKKDKLSSTVNDMEDFIQQRIGKIGVQTYPKMVKEYRDSLLRIEKMIFDEVNELFMLVY